MKTQIVQLSKNFGTKWYNDECSLKFYDVTASNCDDGKYTLKFNFHHVAPDNGFPDLYNNGVHYWLLSV
ncbi:MAG: hypothetical protein IPO48_19145 [Saprospiraceae bacterium]|nr:hypothetical protein [Saprospiraceae bacterium]